MDDGLPHRQDTNDGDLTRWPRKHGQPAMHWASPTGHIHAASLLRSPLSDRLALVGEWVCHTLLCEDPQANGAAE